MKSFWSCMTCLLALPYSLSFASDYAMSRMAFNEMQSQLSPYQNALVVLPTVEQINETLQGYSAPQQLVIISFWLRQLSQSSVLSPEHIAWLETLKSSADKITTPFPEHPERSIDVINIAQQAMTTERLVSINQKVVALQTHWQEEGFQWSSVIEQGAHDYQAFVIWFRTLPQTQKFSVYQNLEKANVIALLPDNQLFTIYLSSDFDTDIFSALIARKVDEFTHQYVQALPAASLIQDVAAMLIVIEQHPKLQSQAQMLMMKHYDSDARVQDVLLANLRQPEKQWHVVALLQEASDSDFKQRVNVEYKGKKSRLANVVMTQILGDSKQDSQGVDRHE